MQVSFDFPCFTWCPIPAMSQRGEAYFLFCLSRNVGRPDRLAFHWKYTAESPPHPLTPNPTILYIYACFYYFICAIS